MGIRISIEQPEPLIGTAAADEQGPFSFEGWLGLPGVLFSSWPLQAAGQQRRSRT
jgi:hypothetical protein